MTRTADLNSTLVAGVDAGATITDVHFEFYRSSVKQRYKSGDFASLDDLLDQSLLDLKKMPRNPSANPKRMVLAIAGQRHPNGDVQMTNIKHWPLFEVAKTAERLGTQIETVNDVVAAAAGLAENLAVNERQVLQAGMPDPDGPRLVVTVSTGIGNALLLPDDTVVPSEGGHAWEPMNALEHNYLEFLRAKYGTDTITVEVAASGGQGFDNLYDFLVEAGHTPGDRLRGMVFEYRHDHPQPKGIGPLLTANAMKNHSFSRKVMELFGSILGQHLRNLAVVTMPTGGVFFVGRSVMQAPGVAEYVVKYTPFLERFIGSGAERENDLKDTPLYVITDGWIAGKGALAFALR